MLPCHFPKHLLDATMSFSRVSYQFLLQFLLSCPFKINLSDFYIHDVNINPLLIIVLKTFPVICFSFNFFHSVWLCGCFNFNIVQFIIYFSFWLMVFVLFKKYVAVIFLFQKLPSLFMYFDSSLWILEFAYQNFWKIIL